MRNAHGGPIQVEGAVDIERENSAGRAVEWRRGRAGGERRGDVLRHADDLEVTLSLSTGRCGSRVGVDEPAADRQRASPQHRVSRNRVLVTPGVVGRGPSGGRITGDAVTVSSRVRGVDWRILHLDDEKQVAGRDWRRRTDGGAQRDGGGAGRCGGGAWVIRVDNAVEGGRAVSSRGSTESGRGGRNRRNQERGEGGHRQEDKDPPARAPWGHFGRTNETRSGNRRC